MNNDMKKKYQSPIVEGLMVIDATIHEPQRPNVDIEKAINAMDPVHPRYNFYDRKQDLADTFSFKRKGFKKHQR